jgi:hypothetical protein
VLDHSKLVQAAQHGGRSASVLFGQFRHARALFVAFFQLLIFLAGLRQCVWLPGLAINQLVTAQDFSINVVKTTHRTLKERQQVTGITVNSFLNLPRRFIRQIQGAIYAWEKHGYQAANRCYRERFQIHGVDLENVLRGRLAYLKMVRGEHDYLYRRLARHFNRLTSQGIRLPQLRDTVPTPLRADTARSGGWNSIATNYLPGVVLLKISDLGEEGNDYFGTAFHVGHGVFATAGHNLVGGKSERTVQVCHDSSCAFPGIAIRGDEAITDVSPDTTVVCGLTHTSAT